ncbi:hypothetical protein BC829DRAFT_457135 [Chytridium lagenaria]|nr:hypothetical protein BC829DRAFT_457135 [Chytridium lagenaria]
MDLLTLLVSDLLTRLTSHNDTIPLHPTQITRFHSRPSRFYLHHRLPPAHHHPRSPYSFPSPLPPHLH